MATISDIVGLLREISEDHHATKNLKLKLAGIITILSSGEGLSLKINKASHELDDLTSNSDLDSYTRTQLMGVAGALETIEE